MKHINKVLSFILILALSVTFIPQTAFVHANEATVSSLSATEDTSTVNLFKGTKEASTWTQVLTFDTIKDNGTFDPSIIKEGGYFQASYTGDKDGIQMIFQSWSGGTGWAVVNPSEITTAADGSYLVKFTYDDITASYGTNLQVLDRLYFNTTTGAITLTSLDYVTSQVAVTTETTVTVSPEESIEPSTTVSPEESVEPSATVTPEESVEPSATVTPEESIIPSATVTPEESATPSSNNTINIFTGSVEMVAWAQGDRISTLKDGGTFDSSVINTDGYFAVSYTGTKDSVQLIFSSWSGGEGWATISSTAIIKNAYQDYTAIFDYDTIAAVYGTSFTTLDAIYPLVSTGSATLTSIDYVMSGVQEAIESASATTAPTIEPSYVAGDLAERTFTADDTHVKVIGRTYVDADGARWITNSASGIEFSFTGTKASVTIETSNTASETNEARLAIYVNGTLVEDDMMDQAEKTYDFFQSSDTEAVVVRIIKLSESACIPLAISSISVTSTADIEPTPEKTHKIEFIGDSITCGYGVDDENISGGFKTATENGSKTYAYKTAQSLDADYSIIAASGFGVVSGYTSGEKNTAQTIPQYYNSLGFSWYPFSDGTLSKDVSWDFDQFQPDAIVINLGTNDNSYCGSDSDRKAEFVESYIDFLKQIRTDNPNSTIFCTLGIMGQELYPQIQEAVSQYTASTGDTNITCMEFDVQSISNGICVDYHPSETTHAIAAEALTDYINYFMGW